jgi:hypothetical protein
MEKNEEKMLENLTGTFPVLTEENKKIVDMIKFLILTQNNIVPSIINREEKMRR